ncbi:MAG: hypothetical protein V3S82_10095 [Dehalococcoidia bacterium]
MKVRRKIPWILGLIVTILIFGVTVIQSPTTDIIGVLGQFLAAAASGVVVFLVSYGSAALAARLKK